MTAPSSTVAPERQLCFPVPAPKANDRSRPNKTYYKIPIAIQDRSFNSQRVPFYPDTRAFFDGIAGPYIPETGRFADLEPGVLREHDHGQRQHVAVRDGEQRRYRFRFLNGCQSRFLILDFGESPASSVADRQRGGFLAAPVNLEGERQPAADGSGGAGRRDRRLHERAGWASTSCGNLGPDQPFGGGNPGVNFEPADPASTGRVLQFRVVPPSPDPSTPPRFLVLPGDQPPHRWDGPTAGAVGGDVGVRRAAGRLRGRADRGTPRHDRPDRNPRR